MKARSIFYPFLITLVVSLLGIHPSTADDNMPMGQGSSPQSKMGGMGHDMMMPMGQGNSPQSKMGGMGQGMMMPMGQGNSPQSKMGGMGQGMMMPMGQGSSPQSKMGGMPMGQTDSGAPGSTGMDEHAGHHNEGMSGDTAEPNSMQFPSSSLQDQVRIEELARKRINTASNMITEGVLVLSRAKESNDRRKVRDALRKIRYGVDEFESGLAAQEALEQGMAPRNIAIQWFKNELNLTTQTNHGDILGISWFHFFVMVALVFFAVIMIWMYFFKMRRAAEVLNHVAGSGKDAGGGKKKQDEK